MGAAEFDNAAQFWLPTNMDCSVKPGNGGAWRYGARQTVNTSRRNSSQLVLSGATSKPPDTSPGL
jgi:hypothetical protein